MSQEFNLENLDSLGDKSLKELIQIFQELIERGDQQMMYKYADSIKASFYKALKREKIAAGCIIAPTNEIIIEEQPVSENPFAEIERGFKDLYAKYKVLRTEYLKEADKQKEDNLALKKKVLDDLRDLIEKQEDVNQTFPEFRELQARWKEIGTVPSSYNKELWEQYQFMIEKFYDYVKINNEFRDLDFKKNLEAKTELCIKAEKLIESDSVVEAFKELQNLHEEWKELGPVPKEMREEIWERFKKATSAINKRQQDFFENKKVDQKRNLELKTALCVKVEELFSLINEQCTDAEWNKLSKQMDSIQEDWRKIGFAAKKDNQTIYDRFRSICDQFYDKKREHYNLFKKQMQENLTLKTELCEQAEAIKDSQEWKKTTDQLIAMQKKWKEIGPVSRKHSDMIWKRFRAACDQFFENKTKYYGDVEKSFEDNLESKRAIIAAVQNYEPSDDEGVNKEALDSFNREWTKIGFVPIKEKDAVYADFRKALSEKFHKYRSDRGEVRHSSHSSHANKGRGSHGVRSERDKLVQRFKNLESDISTYENNIGFFAKSKKSDSLVKEYEARIASAKEELMKIEEQIKSIDNHEE